MRLRQILLDSPASSATLSSMNRRDILKMAVSMTPLVVAGDRFKRITPPLQDDRPSRRQITKAEYDEVTRMCKEYIESIGLDLEEFIGGQHGQPE